MFPAGKVPPRTNLLLIITHSARTLGEYDMYVGYRNYLLSLDVAPTENRTCLLTITPHEVKTKDTLNLPQSLKYGGSSEDRTRFSAAIDILY